MTEYLSQNPAVFQRQQGGSAKTEYYTHRQKFCMVQFCVVILRCFIAHMVKTLNIETEKSEQTPKRIGPDCAGCFGVCIAAIAYSMTNLAS